MTDNFLKVELNKWKDEVENEKVSIIKSLLKTDKIKNSKIKSVADNSWFVILTPVTKKTIFELNDGKHWSIKLKDIKIPFEIPEEEFNKTLDGDNYLLVFHKKAISINGKYDLEDVILRFPNVKSYEGNKTK